MKKLVGLMLTSVMALSLLAGCGGTKDEDTATTAPTTAPPAATTAPPADDNTEEEDDAVVQNESNPADLTGTVRVGLNPWKEARMETVIALFNEKFPNVEVIIEPYDANPPGLITDLAVNNELPDMYFETAKDAATLAAQGLLYPLNEFLDADPEAQYLPQTVMDGYTYNGYTYCLPNRVGINMILINTDVMDELNLEMPRMDWSYDEFKQFLINGTTSTYSGIESFWGANAIGPTFSATGLHQHGYDQYTHTFDLVNTYVKGTDYLQSLSDIPGVVANTLRGDDNADYIKKFGEGDVGDGDMAWKMGKLLCKEDSTSSYSGMVNYDFDPYWHAYPQDPSVGLRPIAQFEHSYMLISAENPQATYEFMKWVSYDVTGVGALVEWSSTPNDQGTTRNNNPLLRASSNPALMAVLATHPNYNDDMVYMMEHIDNAARADLDAFVINYWTAIEDYGMGDATTIEAAQDIQKRASEDFVVYYDDFLNTMKTVQDEFNATH